MREFSYNRDTKETKISISLNLDGSVQNAVILELFTDHGAGTLIREAKIYHLIHKVNILSLSENH